MISKEMRFIERHTNGEVRRMYSRAAAVFVAAAAAIYWFLTK